MKYYSFPFVSVLRAQFSNVYFVVSRLLPRLAGCARQRNALPKSEFLSIHARCGDCPPRGEARMPRASRLGCSERPSGAELGVPWPAGTALESPPAARLVLFSSSPARQPLSKRSKQSALLIHSFTQLMLTGALHPRAASAQSGLLEASGRWWRPVDPA